MKKPRTHGTLALLLFVGLMLFVSTNAPAVAQEQSGPLDGYMFVGETGKAGKTTGDPDELTFKAGMFHSKACDPYGFGDGVYTVNAAGDAFTFEATTVSASEGKIVWKGTVKGEELNGSFVWHRTPKWYRFFLGNDPVEYWVKATLKK
jgi:hypothetical protein